MLVLKLLQTLIGKSMKLTRSKIVPGNAAWSYFHTSSLFMSSSQAVSSSHDCSSSSSTSMNTASNSFASESSILPSTLDPRLKRQVSSLVGRFRSLLEIFVALRKGVLTVFMPSWIREHFCKGCGMTPSLRLLARLIRWVNVPVIEPCASPPSSM